MQVDMTGHSFQSHDFEIFSPYIDEAVVPFADAGGSPSKVDTAASFNIAMPAPAGSGGDWYAFRATSTTGELAEFMRTQMLEEIGNFYNVDLPLGVGSGLYDCNLAELANLWHNLRTETPFTPGARRLSAIEMSYLIANNIGFQEAVRAEFVQKGAEGAWESWDHSRPPTPLLMDGLGTITTPDVSECVSTGLAVPGGENLPPGETLPETRNHLPTGSIR